ncbi:NRDE family protein [Pleomorphovibrio marinus]|uniref:NRDE family protein n=1 Tax=Pleomorphovibrio marinus TaxID=2164132 RepID=UPI000E09F588|nr:NRDE family protein [Pleomorphovibrio marinus]
MCLIAFKWMDHPVYKLVLVANRDEYYDRPSQGLHKWEEGFYAGKDLKAGGTWMGFHPSGKFAALTNYRDIPNELNMSQSRGDLVKNFLTGNLGPKEYTKELESKKFDYNGYNLLVAEGKEMYYSSNYMEGNLKVPSGLHGLSNALLNVPWPKLSAAKAQLSKKTDATQLCLDSLLQQLQSKDTVEDLFLPKTGLEYQHEKAVSAQFIEVKNYYGTVNTTALLWGHDGKVRIKERRFIPKLEENSVEFGVKSL